VSGDPDTDEEWAELMERRYPYIIGALQCEVSFGSLTMADVRLFDKLAGSFAERVAAERRTALPSFTCPYCFRTSYNKNDIENRYCGNCHRFVDDPVPEVGSPS
jgi:hypothetical protein